MKKEQRILAESLAQRYMTLSGIPILEEVEEIDTKETREDAFAGGDNLSHPIDHAKVVSDESNVQGVETACLTTGEVTVVSESKISELVEKVRARILERQS